MFNFIISIVAQRRYQGLICSHQNWLRSSLLLCASKIGGSPMMSHSGLRAVYFWFQIPHLYGYAASFATQHSSDQGMLHFTRTIPSLKRIFVRWNFVNPKIFSTFWSTFVWSSPNVCHQSAPGNPPIIFLFAVGNGLLQNLGNLFYLVVAVIIVGSGGAIRNFATTIEANMEIYF